MQHAYPILRLRPACPPATLVPAWFPQVSLFQSHYMLQLLVNCATMQEHLTEGFNDEESDSVETTLNTTLHWTYQRNSWTWASNFANARNKPSKSSWAYEERFILSTIIQTTSLLQSNQPTRTLWQTFTPQIYTISRWWLNSNNRNKRCNQKIRLKWRQ